MKKGIEKKTFEQLKTDVIFWGNKREILHREGVHKQFVKFIEESGELAKNILKGVDCTDDFGDVLVTLIIMSKQLNYDLVKCLDFAYNEIKDREGKTVNGVFIKDEK